MKAPQWRELPALITARRGHTVTVLADGALLVIGGTDANGASLDSIELLVPGAPAWVRVGHLAHPRTHHRATLLQDNRVLVSGGFRADDVSSRIASTELVSPAIGSVEVGPELRFARSDHQAVLAGNGDLWMLGGTDGAVVPPPELLRRGGRRFERGPALQPSQSPLLAWSTKDGVVAIVGNVLRAKSPIPKYSRWLNAGYAPLPPVVTELSRTGASVVTHRLPPTEGVFVGQTRRGTVVFTDSGMWLVWIYDPASRTFTAAPSPPPGLDTWQIVQGPAGTVIAFNQHVTYSFDGETWTDLVAMPADAYEITTATTVDSLVLVGGMDRRRPDRGVTDRVIALSISP